MISNISSNIFIRMLSYHHPNAQARIKGGSDYPQIRGIINFYHTPYAGVLMEVEVFHLPNVNRGPSTAYYGMHIHENGNCTPPFNETGSHYNPSNTEHPLHAGDLPPLISNQGYAWMSYYDEKLHINEIVGRSVIIHDNRDDFTSQPSGDSGNKIACGEIILLT